MNSFGVDFSLHRIVSAVCEVAVPSSANPEAALFISVQFVPYTPQGGCGAAPEPCTWESALTSRLNSVA